MTSQQTRHESDEENCFLVTDREGRVHEIFGKGAGRCPTANAVFADVMDAQRTVLGRRAAAVGALPGRASGARAERPVLKLKLRA